MAIASGCVCAQRFHSAELGCVAFGYLSSFSFSEVLWRHQGTFSSTHLLLTLCYSFPSTLCKLWGRLPCRSAVCELLTPAAPQWKSHKSPRDAQFWASASRLHQRLQYISKRIHWVAPMWFFFFFFYPHDDVACECLVYICGPDSVNSLFSSSWMKKAASMQSARSGAGPRSPSKWALLQAKLLAPICGRTTNGSSTRITCSRPETICL